MRRIRNVSTLAKDSIILKDVSENYGDITVPMYIKRLK